ncbi:hypothetical protein F444_15392 [Phytophthora nicotianae P1976]|uniref:MULE transposase domain-containing protein n=1 Tax=Phytophthora nicotianae P1976 TaxID=1317066 RepID=A0A080ZM57_PHYNI|nr:hypothetical protein F444_15392 [Phytophthora nicotianae P1976]
MAYEPAVDLYLPIRDVLVQNKSQETYWRVLNVLITLSNSQLEPQNVTCDFKVALINAVLEHFPRANLALRRKMVNLRIPEDQIKDALSSGKLDTLTRIPVDEIRKKGEGF